MSRRLPKPNLGVEYTSGQGLVDCALAFAMLILILAAIVIR